MKTITCGLMLLFSTFLMAQEFGLASYYADSFQGISTASGEAYDKVKFTCAHNSHPFGTILKVTRLDNNTSVSVRVNDRGPFIKGRIVDISRAAAEQLDLIRSGTAQVRVDLADGGKEQAALADATRKGGATTAKPKPASAPKPSTTAKTKKPTTYVDKNVPKDKPVPKRSTGVTTTASKAKTAKTSSSKTAATSTNKSRYAKDYKKYGLYQIQLLTPKTRGYGVQVASFASYDNVMNKVAELQGKWFDEILVKSEPNGKGETVYKVILGNFDSQAAAANYKKNLKNKHRLSGFVVNLDQ